MITTKTRLIWITPQAEDIIAYCARVSSENQDNPNISNLIEYCLKHGHWSILEQACACFEIITSRAISAQIIRHRSFSFQEFSQRYSPVSSFEAIQPRIQDTKNRQNSFDAISYEDSEWFQNTWSNLSTQISEFYDEALKRGIAKESARFSLPMCSTTRLYMTGNIRSWVHYVELRCGNGTQAEHKEIASEIKERLCHELPIISKARGWNSYYD